MYVCMCVSLCVCVYVYVCLCVCVCVCVRALQSVLLLYCAAVCCTAGPSADVP